MLGDFRIEELAPQRFEAFEGAALIGADQPRIARHIGRENRREPTGLAHVPLPAAKSREISWEPSRCIAWLRRLAPHP
jgi:hypothetical protein